MRVNPVSFAKNFNLSSKNNLNFGKIDPQHREEILNILPIQAADDFSRQLEIDFMDNNQGVTVKLGSKDDPRGLVYAELNPEHVEKSCLKNRYIGMSKTKEEYLGQGFSKVEIRKITQNLGYFNCLNNLQNREQYEHFISEIISCQEDELPDGSPMPKSESKPSNSSDSKEYEPDDIDRMWELYGTRL